ncbi:BON domain-containing protein [Panacagrimonas sp.]|uniref:BON domain-containing protein n=1 Tax=Panacagrimonas sp. TaxID=2480088 RepID=UPI003B51AB48
MKLNPVVRSTLLAAPLLFAGAAFSASDNATGDELITAKVKTVLAQDKRLQVQTPIEVQTRNGVVSLAGDVETPAMVYRAVEKVRAVEGVREVDTHHLDAR